MNNMQDEKLDYVAKHLYEAQMEVDDSYGFGEWSDMKDEEKERFKKIVLKMAEWLNFSNKQHVYRMTIPKPIVKKDINIEDKNGFYNDVLHYFGYKDVYRMMKQTWDSYMNNNHIENKEALQQSLIDVNIIKIVITYDCPNCSDPLSLEGDQYICTNCNYSASKEEIERDEFGEQDIYKGENFDQLKTMAKPETFYGQW